MEKDGARKISQEKAYSTMMMAEDKRLEAKKKFTSQEKGNEERTLAVL